jgi:hypothetical protein
MITKKFTPTWRHGKQQITLVSEPDAAWFQQTGGTVRFSVLANGSVWWGDADEVLHADIIRLRPLGLPVMTVEIFITGVLQRRADNNWGLCFVQNFTGIIEDHALTLQLLNRLTTWSRDTASLSVAVGQFR